MNVHIIYFRLSISVGWWVPVLSEWAGGTECHTHGRGQNHPHGPQYSITSDLCRKICLMGHIYTLILARLSITSCDFIAFCLLFFWALAAGIEPFVYYIVFHFDSKTWVLYYICLTLQLHWGAYISNEYYMDMAMGVVITCSVVCLWKWCVYNYRNPELDPNFDA